MNPGKKEPIPITVAHAPTADLRVLPRGTAFITDVGMIGDFAGSVGVATPLLDCVAPLYERFMTMGLGDNDVAAMVDVIGALPRKQ